MFKLIFVRWHDPAKARRNERAEDFLPGFQDVSFRSKESAMRWYNNKYLGRAKNGLEPVFTSEDISERAPAREKESRRSRSAK